MTVKIIVNPDREFVSDFGEKLKQSNGYCPCALEHIPDTKCMCKTFREQQEGWCHCGLYKKIILDEVK